MEKVLIDSDICLDLFLQRKPFVQNSAQILMAAEQKKIKAFVSGIAFDNIFYVLRKNSNSEKAIDRIKRLRSIVGVGRVTEFTIDHALDSGWRDFEDALQYWCAVETGCDTIVTRNIADFKDSKIPVSTPEDYLANHLL